MSSSLLAVQTGIYSTLTNDATLMALLVAGSGVRDHIPPNPKYPHIVIGDSVEVPDRTMGQGGHEVLADITIYTRDGSTDAVGARGSSGYREGLLIFQRVTELLVGTPAGVRTLTVTGFDLIDVDVDFVQTERDTDGLTRTIDARYRLRLEVPLS